MRAWVMFMLNEMPINSHGGPEAVRAWIARGGLAGVRPEAGDEGCRCGRQAAAGPAVRLQAQRISSPPHPPSPLSRWCARSPTRVLLHRTAERTPALRAIGARRVRRNDQAARAAEGSEREQHVTPG